MSLCLLLAGIANSVSAQAPSGAAVETKATGKPEVAYPLNLAVGPGDAISIVDLDLPGVWRLSKEGDELSLLYRGASLLRKPMNRPRCVVALDDGSLLVGDSASRDIYRITDEQTELKGLTDGFIGIPMCLAVDPTGTSVFVGDAEKRSLFRFPLTGGEPQRVAPVNARGLSFDSQGVLWAITPDDAAVVKIDNEGQVTPLVTGRPFQYPGGLVHVGDVAYVTDGYGKSIWQVSADGTVSEWFQGEPLKHPVGIAALNSTLLVADPHSKQIFRFFIGEKPTAEPLLP